MKKSLTLFMSLLLCTLVLFSFVGCSNPYETLIEHLTSDPKYYSATNEAYYAQITDTNGHKYKIVYDEEEGLYFHMKSSDSSFQVRITKLEQNNKTPAVAFKIKSSTASGYIESNTFYEESKIKNFKTNYYGEFFFDTQEKCETVTFMLLFSVNEIIKSFDIGLTLADLGFDGFN